MTTQHNPNERPVKLMVRLYEDASGMASEDVAAAVQEALTGSATSVAVIPPTIDQLNEVPPGYEPGNRHSYSAHDSGFMMFAVETDGYGTFHATSPEGKELARTDRIRSFPGDENTRTRAAWHQLIDMVMDLPDSE